MLAFKLSFYLYLYLNPANKKYNNYKENIMKEIKIYKCDICGNIVLKLVDLTEKLVCCGEPMILIKANSTDGANEKHVPFIKETIKPCKELNGDITEIQVGSTVHPMLPEHHIAWIGTFSDKSWDIK
jgi:superoxide reductase